MYSVVGTDGQVYGPVAIETLKEWVAQGRIAGGTNLIDGLDGRVFRADNLPELHPVLLTAPPVIASHAPVAEPPLRGSPPAPMSGYYPQVASPLVQEPVYPYPTGNIPYNPQGQGVYVPQGGYVAPVMQAPVQQAAAFQQGVPGMPSIQVNNYIATNNTALNQQAPILYGVLPPPCSKTTAILLCIFLGGFGAHRYYLRHNGTATTMLLITLCSVFYLSGISGIWAIVDLIQICTGGLRDAYNRELV